MRPKVYRADRGRKLVVANGGAIEVQVGGEIDMEGEIVQSVEFDTDYFEVDDGTVTLKAEVAALLAIVAGIPTADPEQDWEVYLSEGKLVVSHDNE